jgi:hypothetical protein
MTRSKGKKEYQVPVELDEETVRTLLIAWATRDPRLGRLFAPFVLLDVALEPGARRRLSAPAKGHEGVPHAAEEHIERVAKLERRVEVLEARVGILGDPQSLIVPVTTLDPEPFELLRDIHIVIRPTEDGYLATLYDANIGITGDTREEAVMNLRELIVDLFDELEEDEDRLGPVPRQQLAVLRSLMRRRE